MGTVAYQKGRGGAQESEARGEEGERRMAERGGEEKRERTKGKGKNICIFYETKLREKLCSCYRSPFHSSGKGESKYFADLLSLKKLVGTPDTVYCNYHHIFHSDLCSIVHTEV